MPGLCVDNATVRKGHEEFSGLIFDVDEIVDNQIDNPMNFGGGGF
jgi:hypothetical protein